MLTAAGQADQSEIIDDSTARQYLGELMERLGKSGSPCLQHG
jgi:hypothetical protein